MDARRLRENGVEARESNRTVVVSLRSHSEAIDIVEVFIVAQLLQCLGCLWRFRDVPRNSDRVCQIVPRVAPPLSGLPCLASDDWTKF